jgi:ADP-ribose pyrophosphatase YjhB (NUDIX family)
MTLGVRGIARDEAGRVLLVRHTYSKGWHLPGGGVERGETALQSALREMAEEGGVEAIGAPALVGFYSNHHNFSGDHIALYHFTEWRPCAHRIDNEIAERAFFAMDALPADTTKGTHRRLAEVFAGATLSETW